MKNLKKVITPKFILELALMTVLYMLLDMTGIKKYIVVLMVGIVFFFLGKEKKWSLEMLICVAVPLISYLIVGGISVLLNANPQIVSIKEIFFWTVPLIFAFAMYLYYGNSMDYVIDVQFYGSCVAYILPRLSFLLKDMKSESTFAFVFGAFVIYYAYKKRWLLACLALILTVLANKKIVIVAVLAVLLVLMILYLFKKRKNLVLTIWALFISAIFYYIYLIHSKLLMQISYRAFSFAANGRMTIYDRFAELYEFSPFYIGQGLGIVTNILECWNIPTYANLHNDLLKFYIELGFIGLLLFLGSYTIMFYMAERIAGKSKMCFMLVMILYFMLLCATDNVSIYILFLIPMYSMMFAVLSKGNNDTC